MKRIFFVLLICAISASHVKACEINLNKVTAAELVRKLGIKMQQANLIVTYRKRKGKLIAMKELYNIPGLSDATISQIREDANTCID